MEPAGFLPFTVEPQLGDRLVLYPVYLCPIGILERGLFARPTYCRRVVAVNAFNHRSKLLNAEEVPVNVAFDATPFDKRCLDVKISPELAAGIAENGAVPDEYRGWRGIARNRRADVNANEMRLVWHVYAVRGSEAIDTFTGETVPAEALITLLFG